MGKGAQTPTTVKSILGRRRERATLFSTLAEKPLLQFILFAAFVVGVVGVMTAGFDVRGASYRDYTVGQVAPHDIKATRDFAFAEKDIDASEQHREEVAEKVPAVFDWQEGASERLRDRVSRAFGGMRDAMANAIRDTLAREDPERLAALESGTSQMMLSQALLDLVNERQRLLIARQLRQEVFDQNLGVAIRDSDFETFARAGFPPSAENALIGIITDVMSNVIVASQNLIDANRERGVFLRRLRDDKLLIEYHVANVGSRFVPIDEVPALVREAAAERLGTIGESELRESVQSTATAIIESNTSLNHAKTAEKRQAARESVDDLVVREDFRKGQIIVDKGHLISERHLRIMQKMHEEEEYLNRTQVFAGVVLFCLLFLVTLYLFGRRNIRKFNPTVKDVIFMGSVLLMLLMITRIGTLFSQVIVDRFDVVPVEAWYFAIPVAASGMLIRLVLNSEHAIVFTVLFAVLVGIVADNSLFFASYAAVGGLVGAGTVKQVKNRMALMWSGLVVGVVNVAAVVAFLLIQGELLQFKTLVYAMLAFGGGITSGFLISAVLPLFETLFGYTTDIKLLELANLNHPALRELIMRAPGSYHHSMMVGSLCEAAAEAIGCNPLLSRVGAYYHDIGKAKNPQYFAENQKLGENPHDRLKPNMSALVIKAHVKDGLEMAKQHRLPEVIQDFIAQHHGTSLIAYFYHKAKQLEDPDIPEVDEKDYRYPGPKPQTRETAICMLADGVEAASRAMPDPSAARLKGLVQKMINHAFTDGQLDECDLTLKDLNKIARAFTRILTGIYHHRPEYPTDRRDRGETESRETRRTKRVTGRTRRTTPAPAIAREADDAPETSLAETSSDVWEITADKVQDIEEDLNGGRHHRGREGKDASTARRSDGDDPPEGRQSLPRLGSS